APVELPRRDRGAHDVVAPLDDDARDVPDLLNLVEKLLRLPQERPVNEVVALDSRERLREAVAPEAGDELRVGKEAAGGSLPEAPGARGAHAHRRVLAREPPVVGGDQVAALGGRDRLEVLLPRVREEEARALLVEPRDLLRPDEEDAAQD